MAKYLGIDYGTKRIGLAVSDDEGKLAFPHSTVSNSKKVLAEIAGLSQELGASVVVVGESLKLDGSRNAIMKDIDKFVEALKKNRELDVVMEPEFWTSENAERYQKDKTKLDASAAALILQSYLDKVNNSIKD